MNRKLGLATICTALMASLTFAESLDDVTSKLQSQLKEIKSLTADMKMVMNMEQGGGTMSMTMEGKMSGAQRDDKYYARSEASMDMEMKMGEESQKMSGTMLSVTDGEFTWVVQDIMGPKQVMKRKIDDVPALGDAYIEQMKEDNELSLGESTSVDGQDCWVIVAVPKKQDPMGPQVSKMNYYHRKSDGVMLKMEGLDESGKAFMTMNLSNIKINPSLTASDFKFEVPEGANVMDMTTM